MDHVSDPRYWAGVLAGFGFIAAILALMLDLVEWWRSKHPVDDRNDHRYRD